MSVNSRQIMQFYNEVSKWPSTQVEMNLIAEKIEKLMNVPLVSIFSYKTQEEREKVGIKIEESWAAGGINREGLADYLVHQMSNLYNSTTDFQVCSLTDVACTKGLRLPLPPVIQFLVYSPIKLHVQSSQKQILIGGIVVGSSRKFGEMEELTLRNITQRLADLKAVADLERMIDVRTRFLSIASHELKTPLTSIYGILQLQERMVRLKKEPKTPDSEKHYQFLKMVIRQVERLNELINGLLDVSRIQSGRFMVDPIDTDVAALLSDCIQNRLTVIANEATVKIQLESVPHVVAWVDPVRMEEVFTNLIMNSIRFSPEGGTVWIRLHLEAEGDAFRFFVRDQGPSIPIEDRERIFQPFEQAERTGRLGGLGLGLFISREIAQLHGGNVTLLESVPGKGNVFEAYIPIHRSQLALRGNH